MKQQTQHIQTYLYKIKAANKELTKKEHFKDLLHQLYHGEKEIEIIIDAISAGSEETILNIPRHNKNTGAVLDERVANLLKVGNPIGKPYR